MDSVGEQDAAVAEFVNVELITKSRIANIFLITQV
jgi:hypothetical protein